MNLEYIFKNLLSAGVKLTPGLSTFEVLGIEEKYGFRFPPDLRDFLSFCQPQGDSWIDWRSDSTEKINERLSWPSDGLCFDVKYNAFWLPEWGVKPNNLELCYEIVRNEVNNAPKMIPIFSHRYIPDTPNKHGNPIFSIYQTDIIYYGSDLENYFENEFHYYFKTREHNIRSERIKRIEFWSRLVDDNA